MFWRWSAVRRSAWRAGPDACAAAVETARRALALRGDGSGPVGPRACVGYRRSHYGRVCRDPRGRSWIKLDGHAAAPRAQTSPRTAHQTCMEAVGCNHPLQIAERHDRRGARRSQSRTDQRNHAKKTIASPPIIATTEPRYRSCGRSTTADRAGCPTPYFTGTRSPTCSPMHPEVRKYTVLPVWVENTIVDLDGPKNWSITVPKADIDLETKINFPTARIVPKATMAVPTRVNTSPLRQPAMVLDRIVNQADDSKSGAGRPAPESRAISLIGMRLYRRSAIRPAMYGSPRTASL